MMVMLTLLALGLLSLSAVQLRTSGAGKELAVARANARMALQIAIGQLQQSAGPDTRITATGSILDSGSGSIAQPHITGVWKSKGLDPSSPPSTSDLTSAAKASEFQTWLVSGSRQDLLSQSYAATAPAEPETLVSGIGQATGGEKIVATRVPVKDTATNIVTGSYAYVVLDEGVKASANIGRATPSGDLASQTALLGTGQTPGIDRISLESEAGGSFSLNDSGINLDPDTTGGASFLGKLVSSSNSELGYSLAKGEFRRHFNDLTVHSRGLLTNAAEGGLRYDLNLLVENGLTASELTNQGIYQSTYGSQSPALQYEPKWNEVFNMGSAFLNPSLVYLKNGIPTVRATSPSSWSAGISQPNQRPSRVSSSTAAPAGPVILPSLAKVQMVFSLCARDHYDYAEGLVPPIPTSVPALKNHDWENPPSAFDYFLHVVCTPVITLHNPYNVNLEFRNLKVDLANVPVAMKIIKNGIPQMSDFVPINTMYEAATFANGGRTKRWGFTLCAAGADDEPAPNALIRMMPGEVLVFSPYMPPTHTWKNELLKGHDRAYFNDWRNEQGNAGAKFVNTDQQQAIPGWRNASLGYDLQHLVPPQFRGYEDFEIDSRKIRYHKGSHVALEYTDLIIAEVALVPDANLPDRRMTAEMTLLGANPNATAVTSIVSFDFPGGDLNQIVLGDSNESIKSEPYGTLELLDNSKTELADYLGIRPIAMFSAYAKTTRGGQTNSREDGGYPAKPWLFSNHNGLINSQNIVTESPVNHTYEINLESLPGDASDAIEVEPGTSRGNFITGHTGFSGKKLGTFSEFPLSPFQSFSNLNSTNLAAGNTSPSFAQPVGNSYAHPQVPTDRIFATSGAGRQLVDHSYLLNSVFYDHYYLSGFQSTGSTFGNGQSLPSMVDSFLKGNSRLPDRRLSPTYGGGRDSAAAGSLILDADGYRKAAAFQMVDGAFNVNSTSVEAWKAVLSSISTQGGKVASVSGSLDDLAKPATDQGARFSRFRLPNNQPASGDESAYWQKPIDIDQDELENLATEIVEQVKLRGPFLSMGEFVNRQLGPVSALTLKGPLQAAIDSTSINSGASTEGYDISAAKLTGLSLPNPAALEGQSAAGAPGFLMQADLLAALGNAATVRSDTFVIRTYGEAKDPAGNVTAQAWCEAVVQRTPEYVDRSDNAETPVATLNPVNQTFGRRFVIESFHWLSKDEI